MPGEIKVTVFTMGGEQNDIEVPPDMRTDEFLQQLAIALTLAVNDANGNPVNWRLDNKDTGRTLEGHKTIEENGVRDGHRLSLLRQTVAGRDERVEL
jgi:uncharacterized ubiquitin-like protein YukD